MKHLRCYSKHLYSRNVLRTAVNEFRERFPIAFYAETETDYVLDFCVAEEPERIIHEFDNYVIGLENRVGMQT